jgi:hypothetical protein
LKQLRGKKQNQRKNGEEKQKRIIKKLKKIQQEKGSEYCKNDNYEVKRITRDMGSKETVLGS